MYGLCVNRNDQRLYVNAGKSKKILVYDSEGEYKTGYKYFTNCKVPGNSKLIAHIDGLGRANGATVYQTRTMVE